MSVEHQLHGQTGQRRSCGFCSLTPVQFSPLTNWVMGVGVGWGHEGRFSRDPLPVFSAGGHHDASSSGTGRDLHSLMSIQHFLCWPWLCPPSKVPWRVVLEKLSWRVTCQNRASFCLLTVARRGNLGNMCAHVCVCMHAGARVYVCICVKVVGGWC